MSDLGFGKAAVQKFREQQAGAARQLSLLDQVPADAPADDSTVTVFNGERFVTWPAWRAAQPIAIEEPRPDPELDFAGCDSIWANCNGTLVALVKDEDRWLMYLGSVRRRDFASPFLGHAIRTAESWFGAPGDGWQRGVNLK